MVGTDTSKEVVGANNYEEVLATELVVEKENEINSKDKDENNEDEIENEGEKRKENECIHCEFLGKTSAGLQTHIRSKHKNLFRRFSK